MAEFLNRAFGRAATHWATWRFERSCKRTAALVAAPDVDCEPVLSVEPSGEGSTRGDGIALTADYLAHTLPRLRAQQGLPQQVDPAVVSAWRRLPTHQRRLLLLYEARGLTCRQLARRLNVPEDEAKRTLVAAIVQFRNELEAVEAASESGQQR
jgi:DNA-directed RNA polymerase specialized sigma24 family protein